MASINFDIAPAYPQVDTWGADAERLLRTHPDLTLVRSRQLLELLVRAIEHRSATRGLGSLGERFGSLGRAGAIPRVHYKALDRVRLDANEAVHVRGLHPVGARQWDKSARKSLLVVARAWAWFSGSELPTRLRLPARESVSEEEYQAALLTLDAAEDLVELHRDLDGAESTLKALDMPRLERRGVKPHELRLLELRRDSIRLAAANHQGLTPPHLDTQRSRELLVLGDASVTNELVHYHNRFAVGMLNQLRIDEALEAVRELVEWRQVPAEFAPESFAGLAVRDWYRGALHGTKGQALSFLAHARREPALLDDALEQFELARACFDEPQDLERQSTYELHALVERARLGESMEEDTLRRLAAFVSVAPVLSMGPEWSPAAFAIAAALKVGWATDVEVPWAGGLVHKLDAWWAKGDALPHPYEQLAGGLLLVHPAAAGRLIPALEATAAEDDLIGWIAKCYLADHRDEPAPAPPEGLRSWWDKYNLNDALQSQRATAALPFNYA